MIFGSGKSVVVGGDVERRDGLCLVTKGKGLEGTEMTSDKVEGESCIH